MHPFNIPIHRERMSWWRRLVGGTSGGDTTRRVDFLAEALDLESRGDYANALTSYRLALRERPDDLRVLQNIAIAFTKTSQPEEAIRTYRRALQIDPNLGGAHYGLAFLLLKRGDTAHAAMHLDGFLRVSADGESNAEAQKFRAHAQRTLDELKQLGSPSTATSSDAGHNLTLESPSSGASEARMPELEA